MTEEQAPYGKRELDSRLRGNDGVVSSNVQALKGLESIVAYLQGEGWKVTKSTLHRHIKAGRLRPDEHGVYGEEAVKKYAIGWLKKRTDAEHVRAEKLAEQERKEKIAYQAALRRKMELQVAILEGRYVLKEQMYLELASRAAVLDTGLSAAVQLRAEVWISACSGDHGRTAEFIRAVLADMEDLVDSFSTTREFHVKVAGSMEPFDGAQDLGQGAGSEEQREIRQD